MCTKACRSAFLKTSPIIFAFWFAVELLVMGSWYYYSYVNYLMELDDLSVLFYMGFSAAALGMIVCVCEFVFIRRGLIALISLIIFCFLWLLGFGLFLTESVMAYIFFRHVVSTNLLTRVINTAGYREGQIPMMIRNYQVVNSCCILQDRQWTWSPKTEKVSSCCLSLIQCESKNDWFHHKCIPKLLLEYDQLARQLLKLNIVSLVVLAVLFSVYAIKFLQGRRQKQIHDRKVKEEAEEEEEEAQQNLHQVVAPLDSGDQQQQRELKVTTCWCSC